MGLPLGFGLAALVNLFSVCNEYLTASVISREHGVSCMVDTPVGHLAVANCTTGPSVPMCYNHFQPQNLIAISEVPWYMLQHYRANVIALCVLAGWTATGAAAYVGLWAHKKLRRSRVQRLVQMHKLPR